MNRSLEGKEESSVFDFGLSSAYLDLQMKDLRVLTTVFQWLTVWPVLLLSAVRFIATRRRKSGREGAANVEDEMGICTEHNPGNLQSL